MKAEIEQKNLIQFIIQQIKNILNLRGLKPSLDRLIADNYGKGLDDVGQLLDMNFVTQDETLADLQETMMSNIENQGLEISHKVEGELQRWKLNKENVAQAKKRIREAMKTSTWNYKVKRVVRTETSRANNWGTLDGAIQSGLNLRKWVEIIDDDLTSNICRKEHAKYGSKEQSIPLDKEFIVKYENKTIRAQAPPFHPNCRSVLRIVRAEDLKKN